MTQPVPSTGDPSRDRGGWRLGTAVFGSIASDAFNSFDPEPSMLQPAILLITLGVVLANTRSTPA
jgi:hypothetical protein